MARRNENAGFECARCGARVLPLSNGSYRSHTDQPDDFELVLEPMRRGISD